MLHAKAEVQSKIQGRKLEATIVEADMAEIVVAHEEKASTVRKDARINDQRAPNTLKFGRSGIPRAVPGYSVSNLTNWL